MLRDHAEKIQSELAHPRKGRSGIVYELGTDGEEYQTGSRDPRHRMPEGVEASGRLRIEFVRQETIRESLLRFAGVDSPEDTGRSIGHVEKALHGLGFIATQPDIESSPDLAETDIPQLEITGHSSAELIPEKGGVVMKIHLQDHNPQ